ncbi:integumentary mucin A.1-like isoform X2 [Myxocyprinus asiaticus]|uniref:integumentary mucin A.1-like isoform X2 n=1 Tax=Myxocyprinus asiaticus TaxID=70543 RepID=UPI0022216375|nr:integumentary mucin A.1-like isoform X2 [Myxocyprinus asiaticus]
MKFILLTALLCSIVWRNFVLAVDGPPPNCCNDVKKIKIPTANILDYYIQEKTLCPVRAVVFRTYKNKTICSDPEDNWAKKARKKLDEKVKPSKELRISVTTTTIKTPETETSTREVKRILTTTVPLTLTTINIPETETSTSKVKRVLTTTVPLTLTTINIPETETSTSKVKRVLTTTVPLTLTTIKTPETETSTSKVKRVLTTTVPPTVTTIKIPETETSTSKLKPVLSTTVVTTIKTPETETSTSKLKPVLSTTVPPKVTTIKTPGPDTEIWITAAQPTPVSTESIQSSLSTMTPRWTRETEWFSTTTLPPIETTRKKPGKDTETQLTTFTSTTKDTVTTSAVIITTTKHLPKIFYGLAELRYS